jgi:transcription initiation factor TFIIIB Brf1 subunit/transcription initiation factor TFIIB
MLTSITAEATGRPLTARRSEGCLQCAGRIIDAGEELVCSSCGAVTPKQGSEETTWTTMSMPQATEYTNQSLGSFLGPAEVGYDETFSKGFSKSSSSFKYLKTMSDFSHGRQEASLYTCTKLIERVCEKLALPRAVAGEAVNIAREIIAVRRDRGSFTMAAISAFSVITSCKIRGVTSVGVKAVVDTHRDLGYRVKASTIIQISIDSPIRVGARRPEDYLGTVLARLPGVPLSRGATLPSGYVKKLHRAASVALDAVDGPSRGGHNPRALAATAVYAAEVALARIEGRKKILSQRDTAACVDAAEYTVREQYVEIFKPRIENVYELVRSRESQTQTGTSQTSRLPLQVRPQVR